MRVGFVGLGMVGKGMAANLQKGRTPTWSCTISRVPRPSRFWPRVPFGLIRQKRSARRARWFSLRCRCQPMSSRWH
jgi:hypothetical protein